MTAGNASTAGTGPSPAPPGGAARSPSSPPEQAYATIPAPEARHVAWHRAECGGYSADLPLWRVLAADARTVLDLGCGTGRVTEALVADEPNDAVRVDTDPTQRAIADKASTRPCPLVTALDRDPVLLEQVPSGPEVVVGEVERLDLDRRYDLILAPMQLMQLLLTPTRRASALAGIHRHLEPGGRFAAALAEIGPAWDCGDDTAPEGVAWPEPDTAPLGDWIASSRTLSCELREGAIEIRRERRLLRSRDAAAAAPVPATALATAPGLAPEPEYDLIRLAVLSADELEAEAAAAGLFPLAEAGRRDIPPTERHVGSTVCIFTTEDAGS